MDAVIVLFFNHFIGCVGSHGDEDQLSIPGGLVEKQVEALQVFSSHKCRALKPSVRFPVMSPPTRFYLMNQSSPRIPCCNLTYHKVSHQLFQEFLGKPTSECCCPPSERVFFPSYINLPPAACHWA